MSASAFGVEHGDIAKKWDKEKSDPSVGRVLTGAAFGPVHGAIAGKGTEGKLKTMGAQIVGGTVVPGPVGTGLGTYAAHKRGWLKPQPKQRRKAEAREL